MQDSESPGMSQADFWGFKILKSKNGFELDKSPTARISKTRTGSRQVFKSSGIHRRDSAEVQGNYLWVE